MILLNESETHALVPSPRTRGDDPPGNQKEHDNDHFSPHPRG